MPFLLLPDFYTFDRRWKSYGSHFAAASLLTVFERDKVICIALAAGVGECPASAGGGIEIETGNVRPASTGSHR